MDRVIDIIEKFVFCVFYVSYCLFFVFLLAVIITLPYIFWKLWIHLHLVAIPYCIGLVFGSSIILLMVSTILRDLHLELKNNRNGY